MLAEKYNNEFRVIIAEAKNIFSRRGLYFIKISENKDGLKSGGLHFGREEEDSTYSSLTMALSINTEFNRLQTNYNQRASEIIQKYGRDILSLFYSRKPLLNIKGIDKISFSISWLASDFSNKYTTREYEGLNISIQIVDMISFMNYDIINEELYDNSRIIGWRGQSNLGRINLDLRDSL